MTAKTYDSRCHDLAVAFLSDTPDIDTEKGRAKLAAAIQEGVEDWIEYQEGPCDACGEARGKDCHKDCIHF